jgi:nicotinate-nucleotide pyrophosphorylase (carboxylating)
VRQPAFAARDLDALIDRALAEDVGTGDVTTEALVPAEAAATGELVLREPGVVCGLFAVEATLRRLDPDARLDAAAAEGEPVSDVPAVIASVHASARALLTGERTALNLLQRLSGIATATRRHVDAVAGTGAEVLDTRKTAPGMRELDKHAVACGGGTNHRRGLFDAYLIKDNHLAVVGGVAAAVASARRRRPDLPVEVEVESLEQLDEALRAGVDAVLLDNMPVATLRRAVARARAVADAPPRLEASGGITLDTIRAVAETGVDAISIGALTHSVRALDISLEVHL